MVTVEEGWKVEYTRWKRYHWWSYQLLEYLDFVREYRRLHNGVAPQWLKVTRG
jgi:hypothetical protein